MEHLRCSQAAILSSSLLPSDDAASPAGRIPARAVPAGQYQASRALSGPLPRPALDPGWGATRSLRSRYGTLAAGSASGRPAGPPAALSRPPPARPAWRTAHSPPPRVAGGSTRDYPRTRWDGIGLLHAGRWRLQPWPRADAIGSAARFTATGTAGFEKLWQNRTRATRDQEQEQRDV